MAKLILNSHDNENRTVTLPEGPVSIGKNSPSNKIFNDLVLNDETVSRRHARIFREDDHYCIEDLGSKNHTFVNDRRIKRAQLHDGDVIRIGLNTLVFKSDEAPPREEQDISIDPMDLDNSQTMDLNFLVLKRINETFSGIADMQTSISNVIDLVCQATKAKKGVLILYDDDRHPYFQATSGSEINYSVTIIEQVISERHAVLTRRGSDPTSTMIQRGIRSVMCAPLMSEGKVIGVVYVEDSEAEKFTQHNLQQLTSIANHTAIGLQRFLLNEKVNQELLQRKNVEKFLDTLKQSEAANRALLDANPDLMMHLNRDGTVLSCKLSSTVNLFHDVDPHQQPVSRFLAPDVAELLTEQISKALKTSGVHTFEFSSAVLPETKHYEVRTVACDSDSVLAFVRDISDRVAAEQEKERLIADLRAALAQIKTLGGLIPICASCKKIRDDQGYWKQIELYIQENSDAEFSHGLCDNCAHTLYGDYIKATGEGEPE